MTPSNTLASLASMLNAMLTPHADPCGSNDPDKNAANRAGVAVGEVGKMRAILKREYPQMGMVAHSGMRVSIDVRAIILAGRYGVRRQSDPVMKRVLRAFAAEQLRHEVALEYAACLDKARRLLTIGSKQ